MLASGAPITAARLAGRACHLRRPLRLRRLPQPSAREPLENHVVVGASELRECRKQLCLLACAKCRRLLIDQNRPKRVARRHGVIVPPSVA